MTVTLVGLIAGVGWASGISVYLVAGLVGVFGRLGMVDVPEALTSTPVLAVAFGLFAIEFVADKVPYLDSVWDAVHTVLRPVGAGAIGALLTGDLGQGVQLGAALSSGGLSLVSHGGKAALHAASNSSPEPVSNVLLSTAEQGLAGVVVWLAVTNPVVALVVVLVLSALAVWLLWWGVRIVRRRLRRRRARGSGAEAAVDAASPEDATTSR
ncbi:DUF4126 domain-containing protein [Egibacter rhizosphaerae]|uniref:DUF4126 domain-containing protein n=1 Tax=Egibacter rhizosphaerae TaxID=1670831 RepID=A0A411YDK5_9ACTN|nr:DUF4126 domain-containing protein [Egibacter rhizosphaerae]QBI19291.1 DUF4126 domain-containing protein [Egibacter rhizosphaerae]